MVECPNGHMLEASIVLSDERMFHQEEQNGKVIWTVDEQTCSNDIVPFCPQGCDIGDIGQVAEKSIRQQLELPVEQEA